MITSLKNALTQIDLNVDQKIIEQFNDYYLLMLEYNALFNLTAITEKEEAAVKHFADSASLISFLPNGLLQGKMIDVGSGAGFPGMVLGVLNPQAEIVLLESNGKKAEFLREVKEKLYLKNVSIVCSRAEDAGHNELYRESFDYAVARAVSTLPVLMEYVSPFLKTQGMFIAYKGNISDDEIQQGNNTAEILQMKYLKSEHYSLFLNDKIIDHTLIWFIKTSNLNKKYPRRAGMPSKKPLG